MLSGVLVLLVLVSISYVASRQYRAGKVWEKNATMPGTIPGKSDKIPDSLLVTVARDEPGWFGQCGSRMGEFGKAMTVAAVDLNNDGNDEYVVQAADSYYCGSGGCSFYIYHYTSPRYDRIGEDFGWYAGISGTVHNGFNDIRNEVKESSGKEAGSEAGTVTLRYNGTAYVRYSGK